MSAVWESFRGLGYWAGVADEISQSRGFILFGGNGSGRSRPRRQGNGDGESQQRLESLAAAIHGSAGASITLFGICRGS